MTQMDVSRAGGPSDVTMSRLEKGEPGTYRRLTFDALERALRWKHGAVDAILAGGDPAGWEQKGPSADDLAGAPHIDTLIRDQAVTALLEYADVLDSRYSSNPEAAQLRTEIFRFVRRLMGQPGGFVSQGVGPRPQRGDER